MIVFEETGVKEAISAMRLLTMSDQQKRLILSRVARLAVIQARYNINQQKTVSGQAMTARSTNSNKKGKMFKNIMKGKWARVSSNALESKIWFARNAGYVASKHHFGSDEKYRFERNLSLFPKDKWFEKCKFFQAKELIRCGFAKEKPYKERLKYILDKVTIGDGYNWLNAHKQEWILKMPARPFLGASPAQRQEWLRVMQNDIRVRFKAKNYSHLIN